MKPATRAVAQRYEEIAKTVAEIPAPGTREHTFALRDSELDYCSCCGDVCWIEELDPVHYMCKYCVNDNRESFIDRIGDL